MIFEIYFDGACGPVNPGGTASYGFVVLKDGQIIKSDHAVLGKGDGMTNNLAEHAALVNAFKAFIAYVNAANIPNGTIKQLKVRGDSQLVIKQMNGEYKIRPEKPYSKYAFENKQLREQIRKAGINVSFTWIPREENTMCDDLSKIDQK